MLTLIRKSGGVLGMNARNIEYIRPYNCRRAVRLADNKLRTKEALFKAGIPVPKMYGIIKNRREIETFRWADLPKSFVLKPNHGRGGEGIKIIYGQKKDLSWVSTEGERVTIKDLQNHIMNIFDGFYSLSGIPDTAFFEERVKLSKTLKPYLYRGIPDVRVIVFNKVPVMAMLRLPTKESGGKANLHLGGIGVGIDVATGVTTHAIIHDQTIEKTPDVKLTLSGIKIPYWREILEIAIKCQNVIKLGYIGVDVAIDRDCGPVVLEVNARPGLSIQNANLAPLKYRLQKVKGLKVKSEAHGIRIAQDLFGGEIQQEIEEISGRRILGIIETIKIKYADKEIGNWKLENKKETGNQKLENSIPPLKKSLSRTCFGRAGGISGADIGYWILDIGKKENKNIKSNIAQKDKVKEIKQKEMELRAKIDTGADLSSLDKNLARELGYGAIIDEFDEMVKSLIIDKNATKEKLDEQIKDKLQKWGEDFDTVVIKSSHGISYRLLIKMSIVLSGVEIISKMSIADRSHLEFPVIIGRKDLKRFLVDPSKTQTYLVQKISSGVKTSAKRGDVDSIIKAIIEAENKDVVENAAAKEKIIFHSNEIDKIAGKFNDVYSFITPFGSTRLGNKSYALEIKTFVENINNKEYNPKFEYPNLKDPKTEQFKSILDILGDTLEKIKSEENDLVKQIIQEAIVLMRDKINFLMSVEQKEELKSFEYAKKIYGDINDDLVKRAEEIYQKILESKKEDSERVNDLKMKIFNSKQIANKFRETLDVMNLNEWKVVPEEWIGQIDVKFSSTKYAKPTIAIPSERKLNGINLIRTIIHEIVHIKTNNNNKEAGFGGVVFGRDYELYQEGIARILANDFANDILGAEKELPSPYYILAIGKIKNGYNYHQTFDYVYGLKLKEYKTQNAEDRDMEETSRKEASLICRRVFRGFRESLSRGKTYFPKDKMYLEGEILAQKIYNSGLGNYLIAAKIDPYLLPLFIKLGIINRDKIKYNLDNDLEIYRKLFANL